MKVWRMVLVVRGRAGRGWHAGVAGQEAAETIAEGRGHDVTKILGVKHRMVGPW